MEATRRTGAKARANRRAVRPIKINASLLAIALAPLIFGLCANIVTGGSFSSAFQEKNLWVYPFLAASGVICILSNYREAEKSSDDSVKISRENFGEQMAAVPLAAAKGMRRALVSATNQSRYDGTFERDQEQARFDQPPETLQSLIADLFAEDYGKPKSSAIKAAWSLSRLMANRNARDAMANLGLVEEQLSLERFTWLIRPGVGSSNPNETLNAIQGRIGYLIKKGGIDNVPSSPLIVDPYIAAALIAVRESNVTYHDLCSFRIHDDKIHHGDAEVIELLEKSKSSSSASGEKSTRSGHAIGSRVEYRDLGRLIDPDLLHADSGLGEKQASLIRHAMRHFLDDELSAVLFDSLSKPRQAFLASAMLTASRWMSPAEWVYWATSGQDQVYEPGLEIAHGASFLGSVTLATGIISMTVWQLIEWITRGWSWYFGSTIFLTTWPGWLKAFGFAVFATFVIYALYQLPILGVPTAIAGAIGLIMSVLASPVVRVHGWVTSWGASWTIIISALILTALLYWTGIYLGDRLDAEQPVQLKRFARGNLPSSAIQRTRWYPDHEVGHACKSFILHETLTRDLTKQLFLVMQYNFTVA